MGVSYRLRQIFRQHGTGDLFAPVVPASITDIEHQPYRLGAGFSREHIPIDGYPEIGNAFATPSPKRFASAAMMSAVETARSVWSVASAGTFHRATAA